MTKKLILGALCASSLYGMDVEPFIGIGAEKADVSTKASLLGVSVDDDLKDNTYKLKVGAILDSKHRTYLSYAPYSKDGGDFDLMLVNYEYMLKMTDKTNILIGGHIGKADYSEPGIDFDGIGYGVQIGALYNITENIGIEAGVAYTKYNMDTTVNIGGIGVNLEFEDSTSISTGLVYKF